MMTSYILKGHSLLLLESSQLLLEFVVAVVATAGKFLITLLMQELMLYCKDLLQNNQ